MMELSDVGQKVIVIIISSISLAIGYFYRRRLENKRAKRIALYLLMEIWHRMSVFYRQDFDDFFELFTAVLKEKFPKEKFTDVEIETSKQLLSPVILETVRETALSDLDRYEEKYAEVVSLISSNDPIFAYKISSVSKTRLFLSAIDSYLQKSLQLIKQDEHTDMNLSEFLKSHLSGFTLLDSIKDLEADIRKIALKINFLTFISCYQIIRRRKKTLNKISKDEVEKLVVDVITPVLNTFYQSEN